MDARLPRLESIRARKAEVARLAFAEAFRAFSAAQRHCESLRQRRVESERRLEQAARREMADLSAGAASAEQIAAVHDGDQRRRAALALLDQEIAQAHAERDRLRAIAVEKQQAYLAARRTSEKLGLMVQKLRRDENSLQILLAESRNDSAVRDAATGRWKLQPADT